MFSQLGRVKRIGGIFTIIIGAILLFQFSTPQSNTAIDLSKQKEVRQFIQMMVSKHHFPAGFLEEIFSDAQFQPKVIELIAAPYEKKPWHQYRGRLVSNERAEKGLAFWKQHEEWLVKAEKQYGVPPEIILGIIGVETRYGEITGDFNVLETLATLAFYYPARAEFFKSELEAFLLYAREQKLTPAEMREKKGSYAGAMGISQFIPSSIRSYAIDFDGDGKVDLLNSPADAIGSIANYFAKHKWMAKQSIAMPITVTSEKLKVSLVPTEFDKPQPIAELKKKGLETSQEIPQDRKGFLFALQNIDGPEYWLGLDNLYVITRYNRSIHYAMAVYQLSEKIAALKQQVIAQK